MTNPASTASPSKDNAVRLRENQRRSRQRKKEYLVSLEARFRECQRTGIEASIEIQNAAKRVVRENGRLRELLRRKGVSEAEIDAFVNAEGEEEGRSAVETVVKRLGKIPCGGAAGGETCSKRKTPSVSIRGKHAVHSNFLEGVDICPATEPGPFGFGLLYSPARHEPFAMLSSIRGRLPASPRILAVTALLGMFIS